MGRQTGAIQSRGQLILGVRVCDIRDPKRFLHGGRIAIVSRPAAAHRAALRSAGLRPAAGGAGRCVLEPAETSMPGQRAAAHRAALLIHTLDCAPGNRSCYIKMQLIHKHELVREQQHLGELFPRTQRLGQLFWPAEIFFRVPGFRQRAVRVGVRRNQS